MTKRNAVPSFLCLVAAAACSDHNFNPDANDGPGNGSELLGKIQVDPAEIAFDAVDIVAGDPPITKTVTVTNIGEGSLHILDLYLAKGEISYDVSNLSSLVLSVGASATFTVTFDPKESDNEHAEMVQIASDDQETPVADVKLSGPGLAPMIQVDPIEYDFGYLDVGCEGTQPIAIRNIGNSPLVLDSPPSFTASNPNDLHFVMGDLKTKQMWEFPLTIQPKSEINVTAVYTPLDNTDDSGTLTVVSNDPASPQVRATQTGGIMGADTAEDIFEQPAQPMTDIVFIVDNSGSMTEEQANLANNFDAFIWTLQTTNADYQIGVITTDQTSFRGEVITPDTLNAADKFADQAVAGTGGSGTEKALQMLYGCVQPGSDCSEAGGFMRDDALFAGIIVSDEPDQGPWAPDEYVDYLWGLKDDKDLIKVHAIAGEFPPTCGTCSSPGFGYKEATELTEGTFLDVCALDWGESLSVLALGSVADLSQFKLSQDPVEQTIKVYVDDQQWNQGWWYTGHEVEKGSNAVKFQDEYIPEGGSEVRIEYVVKSDCGG